MNPVDASYLHKLKSLASLTLVELGKLAASLSVKKVKRNEVIFDHGDLANLVYLVISGVARVSVLNHEHKRVLVRLIGPGEIFGTASLTSEREHPVRCDAFTDCTIGAIKPETFVDIYLGVSLKSYLRWADATLSPVWKMYIHCIQGIGLNLRKRLALELLELAANFGIHNHRGAILGVRVSHEDLANSVGASRQKITEMLGKFEREKAIIREDRRLIVIPHKLRLIIETK